MKCTSKPEFREVKSGKDRMEEEKSIGNMETKQYIPESSKTLQYTKSFPFS
jgi:hypothetical protein